MKILVIEDKVSLTDAIAEYLKQKKNIVTIKNDGEKVLLRLEMNSGIEASSFDKIIFVDNRGQMSSYATSITRLLGFDNTFFIRFGLSSWNEAFATTGWDMITSNVLEGKLEHEANEKAAPTTLPNLQTNGTTDRKSVV